MTTTPEQLQNIIEAALMVAGRPLKVADMQKLFDETDQPSTQEIRLAIAALSERYSASAIYLQEVANGFQFQTKTEYSPWLSKLWEERPPRYSRAFLETLALIAYRQPITRAEVEEIRGVAVNSNIIKTLLEREWIKEIGYKDVPGKPALLGTTKAFLDHFNLKSLDQLPTLAEIKDLDSQEAKLQVQLELTQNEETGETAAETTTENESATNESNTDITSEATESVELTEVISEEIIETLVETDSSDIIEATLEANLETATEEEDADRMSDKIPETPNE